MNHKSGRFRAVALCGAMMVFFQNQFANPKNLIGKYTTKINHGRHTGQNQNKNIRSTGMDILSIHNIETLCSSLRQAHHSSALTFWSAHLDAVLEHTQPNNTYQDTDAAGATTNNDKVNKDYHNFIVELLRLVTPHRLQASVGMVPRISSRQWEALEHALHVTLQRWRYLLDKTSSSNQETAVPPRKLNILVMGGSVTSGVRCDQFFVNPSRQVITNKFGKHMQCAWPSRLEFFLNNLLLGSVLQVDHKRTHQRVDDNQVVAVYNAAIAGENSRVGAVKLEYNLLDPDIPLPDIVINAYATNDAQTVFFGESETIMMEDIEAFFSQAMGLMQCDENDAHKSVSPLVIHFDDVIGTEDYTPLQSTAVYRFVSGLSQYFGFTAVSYPSAVRDFVYGHPQEYWFSPMGFYDRRRKGRDIHPRLGMHVVSAWVMAYNLLNLATTYCASSLSSTSGLDDEMLMGDKATFPGRPLAPPNGLPPPFVNNGSMASLATEWRGNGMPQQQPQSPGVNIDSAEECQGSQQQRICPFTWFSRLGNRTTTTVLSAHRVDNNGWEFVTDHAKAGFAPTAGLNSTMAWEFQFDNEKMISAASTIHTVVVVAMTSYGEAWANSTTLVRALTTDSTNAEYKLVGSMEVLGYHKSSTSISAVHTLDLGGAMVSIPPKDLRLEMTLIAGARAKMMGLALCNGRPADYTAFKVAN